MTETATYPVPESGAEPPQSSSRRTAVIASVTAVILVVVGAGAYAAVQFLSGGADAESALPASTVAVASIDLDPGASQKVEAIKTLRKFPALRKQLKINSTGDLRRAIFDSATKEGDCKGLSYDADIKPWIGDSAAIAAVPFGSKVSPVFAIAVTDQDKAVAAFTKLNSCASAKSSKSDASNDMAHWAFGNGFALLSDTQAHADAAVSEAKSTPLADNAAYQEWTGKAGDRGIVNFYVAKAAVGYVADAADKVAPSTTFPSDLPSSEQSSSTDLPSDLPTDAPSGVATLPTDQPSGIMTPLSSGSTAGGEGASAPYRTGDDSGSTARDKITKALKDFQGAAGAVRFADGGMELEVVGGGLPAQKGGTDGGTLVAGLPRDTAAAIGVGVPSDFAEKLVKSIGDLDIPLLGSGSQITGQLETQLGLSLPDDLQTVLGDGIALSLGGKAPADLGSIGGPEDLAAGLSVAGGDATKIKQVVTKLEEQAGGSQGALQLHVEDGKGKVALSFDPDYADDLKADGSLGESKRFTTVVPHAKDAQLVVYADLDSDWATTLAKSGNAKDRQNLAPLQAFGLSAWRDGGTSHLLLKVTTD